MWNKLKIFPLNSLKRLMVETKREMLYKNYFWDLKITKDSSQVI